MRTQDFDYTLPPDLIAQTPAEPRDSSRLMVVRRADASLEHRVFRDIQEYLKPGDVLLRNDTRVIPARLYGRRLGSGGRVEALLLRRETSDTWEALVRPASRLHQGSRIFFEDERDGGQIEAQIVEMKEEGTRLLRFPQGATPEHMGQIPLPPYIHSPLADPERYQTVYAQEEGSAAAPTAGLHFTPELLAHLETQGIEILSITLHVGIDTFRPVRQADPREHRIHQEFYRFSAAVAQRLTDAARQGRRVVCVGTTSVRALEDAVRRSGWCAEVPREQQPPVQSYTGLTGLYILPGHSFLAVDALLTNFHLPRTTLLMLVAAFAGRELILQAYQEAIRQRYRFYSFGDALLLL